MEREDGAEYLGAELGGTRLGGGWSRSSSSVARSVLVVAIIAASWRGRIGLDRTGVGVEVRMPSRLQYCASSAKECRGVGWAILVYDETVDWF